MVHETVKSIRIALCLQQSEFARMIGVTRSAVWHYEHNDCKPSLPVVRRIMDLVRQNGLSFKTDDFLQ